MRGLLLSAVLVAVFVPQAAKAYPECAADGNVDACTSDELERLRQDFAIAPTTNRALICPEWDSGRVTTHVQECIYKQESLNRCDERFEAIDPTVIASNDPEGALVQPLKQQSYEALRNVPDALPIPALESVGQRVLPGLDVSALVATADLEQPQTLGATYRADWIRLGPIRANLAAFATPEPELNPVVQQRLVERDQGEFALQQQGELRLGDDLLYSVNANVVNTWFGRDMRPHAKSFTRLFPAVDEAEPNNALLEAMNGVLATIEVLDGRNWAEQTRNVGIVQCALAGKQRARRQQLAELESLPLGSFWKLVHNQPEVSLTYRRLDRDGFVGAEMDSFRIALESGLFNNVASMKLFSDCDSSMEGQACKQRLKDVAQGWAFRSGLGMRIYYEQGDLADLTVSVPGLAPGGGGGGGLLPLPGGGGAVAPDQITVEGGRVRQYGFSIGFLASRNISPLSGPVAQLLGNGDAGEGRTGQRWSARLDFGMDWYQFDRQPARVNHENVRVVLTLKNGGLSVPVYLLYRTQSEFSANLPGDNRLAVGLGTTWSVF